VRVVLRDSLAAVVYGSMAQASFGWGGSVAYKRAQENARLLYGDFGKAFSVSMQSVGNLCS